MSKTIAQRIVKPSKENESLSESSEPPGLHPLPTPYLAKTSSDHQEDHFIEQNGIKYAGKHLIIDLWGVTNINCPKTVEGTLRESVKSCNATLLFLHLHLFTPNNGLSGGR